MTASHHSAGHANVRPLPSRWTFARRLAGSVASAAALIAVSLLAGMVGYHELESMSWIDAFVNASMILSGMGPMGELHTSGGKFFAGSYALYSGLALIFATSMILAPVMHRVLHRVHLEAGRDND